MNLTRLTRRLAALTLALALTPGLAHAQEPAPAEGESTGSGRSLDGYFVTLALAGMAMFIVGKTARRS